MSYIGQNPVFGDFPYQTLIGDGTASYTLNFNVSNENGLLVFLNGAIQVPGENYTAGGTSLQFADNVPNGTQIFAYGMGLPKSMLSTSAGAIGLNELAAGVYANAAEARSFINDTKMITPKTLADAFTGSNHSTDNPGFQILPSGLILQYGEGVTTSGPADTTVTFPIAFPNSVVGIFVTEYTVADPSTYANVEVYAVVNKTNVGFKVGAYVAQSGVKGSGANFHWFAIGR